MVSWNLNLGHEFGQRHRCVSTHTDGQLLKTGVKIGKQPNLPGMGCALDVVNGWAGFRS